jgi:hypothetical protein
LTKRLIVGGTLLLEELCSVNTLLLCRAKAFCRWCDLLLVELCSVEHIVVVISSKSILCGQKATQLLVSSLSDVQTERMQRGYVMFAEHAGGAAARMRKEGDQS